MISPRRLKWAFGGCKPQGQLVLSSLLNEGLVPEFIALLDEIPDEEKSVFESLAKSHSIRFFTTQNLSEETETLETLDLLLTCRFSLLKKSVFARPRLGSVNIHSSLLPAYRGVHPVTWAIVNGESETGISIHKINDGIDTGDILIQRRTAILEEDNFHTLNNRLNKLSAEAAIALFAEIERLGALPKSQSQTSEKLFYARRRNPEDSRIDWNLPSRRICDLVRALPPPFPPAFCHRQDSSVIKVRSYVGRSNFGGGQPGRVIADTRVASPVRRISTTDGSIEIEFDIAPEIGELLA